MSPANAEVRKLSPRRTLLKAGLWVLLMPAGLSAPGVMGTLRGRITDGSGAPVVKALIAVISAHGKLRLATSDAKGEYAVRDIEPGLYTIWATEGNVSRFDRANLGSRHGQVETIDITLAAGSGQRRGNLPLLVQPPTEFAFLRKGRETCS
jgi:Carboxypeptidase regulatory-like domain